MKFNYNDFNILLTIEGSKSNNFTSILLTVIDCVNSKKGSTKMAASTVSIQTNPD